MEDHTIAHAPAKGTGHFPFPRMQPALIPSISQAGAAATFDAIAQAWYSASKEILASFKAQSIIALAEGRIPDHEDYEARAAYLFGMYQHGNAFEEATKAVLDETCPFIRACPPSVAPPRTLGKKHAKPQPRKTKPLTAARVVPARGHLKAGTYTPAGTYEAFVLRAMRRMALPSGMAAIQARMRDLMAREGALHPLDEQRTGSNIPRYMAQTSSLFPAMERRGLVSREGSKRSLTPEGLKRAEELEHIYGHDATAQPWEPQASEVTR
jgi:hypothetical protein